MSYGCARDVVALVAATGPASPVEPAGPVASTRPVGPAAE
jgi:hypothetical protein